MSQKTCLCLIITLALRISEARLVYFWLQKNGLLPHVAEAGFSYAVFHI